jgi:hypothetical protein
MRGSEFQGGKHIHMPGGWCPPTLWGKSQTRRRYLQYITNGALDSRKINNPTI